MPKDLEKYSMPIVRIWMSFVFLWFGMSQVMSPEDFMGYLPDEILLSDYAELAVLLNGIFEIIWWALLILGIFIRPLALIFTIHLFLIILTLGYNDIAIRDIGLMFATFALFFNGWDIWSLEKYYKKYK